MIIGIDPSFTGTGLAAIVKGKLYSSLRVKATDKSVYQVDQAFEIIEFIKAEVFDFLEKVISENPTEQINIIVEYPAFRTPSGAYLAILMGSLKEYLLATFSINSFYYIPPMACDAFIGNKQHKKSYIVEFIKKKGWTDKRLSHDESTALIFCAIYSSIVKGTYNKSFFKIK